VQIASRGWKMLIGSCAQATATWVFVLSFLTLGIGRDYAYIECAGLALPALAVFVSFRQRIPENAAPRIILSVAILVLIVSAYLVLTSWPDSFGSVRAYDIQAAYFLVTYLTVCVFASLFFEERSFGRVVWRAATATLWVGVLSYLLTRLAHHPFLVSESHGVMRMQGTLTEPSAWAPVIPLVMLMAIRRRSWLHLGLAVIGTALAASPTCLLVLIATVPLYYALTGTRSQRLAVAVGLAALIPVALLFVITAQPGGYLNSHSSAEKTVGRLLAGIESVETGGRQGHNTRFASTKVVIAEVRANGWMVTGAGPAADITYFPAKFRGAFQPNALWVSVLFDFGVIGLVALGALMLAAVWRMRRYPQICAILLPFFVASLINSAEETFEYKFVALGIVLFAFGWVRPGGTGVSPPVALAPTSRFRVRPDRGARTQPQSGSPRVKQAVRIVLRVPRCGGVRTGTPRVTAHNGGEE
jgi:hypothetical protein